MRSWPTSNSTSSDSGLPAFSAAAASQSTFSGILDVEDQALRLRVQRDGAVDHRRRHRLGGDEDVLDAAARHHFRFAERRAADADRAGRDLAPGDLDRFRALAVRPEVDARPPWSAAPSSAMLRSSASRSSSSAGVLSCERLPFTPMKRSFGPRPAARELTIVTSRSGCGRRRTRRSRFLLSPARSRSACMKAGSVAAASNVASSRRATSAPPAAAGSTTRCGVSLRLASHRLVPPSGVAEGNGRNARPVGRDGFDASAAGGLRHAGDHVEERDRPRARARSSNHGCSCRMPAVDDAGSADQCRRADRRQRRRAPARRSRRASRPRRRGRGGAGPMPLSVCRQLSGLAAGSPAGSACRGRCPMAITRYGLSPANARTVRAMC